MIRLHSLLLLFVFLLPAPVNGAQWQLDPAHTNFYFEVQHVFSTIRGRFTEYTGDISFDPAHPEKSRFNFEVKIDSINTMIGKRDTDLRSSNFFDESRYPVMTFRSTKVTPAGDNVFLVEGTLTIKDVSRDLSLRFVYHGQKDHPLMEKKVVAGLDSEFTLDRLEYHVGDGHYYKMGVIGKDVDVFVSIEMLRDR